MNKFKRILFSIFSITFITTSTVLGCLILNNNLSINTLTSTNNLHNIKSSRYSQDLLNTKQIKVSDISNFPNSSSYSATFDEVYIASQTNANDKIFSFTKQNNNLVFTVHKTNDELKNIRFSSQKQTISSINGKDYKNKNQVSITKITSNLDQDNNFAFLSSNDINSSLTNKFITFNQIGQEGYYSLIDPSVNSLSIPIDSNTNIHLRFLVDNATSSTANKYEIYFKSAGKIFSSTSPIADRRKINYYFDADTGFYGIDGFIGFNPQNQLTWSFSTDQSGQNTSSVTISTNSNNISQYTDLKASEALMQIPVAKESTNSKKTWGDILSFNFRAFNYVQFSNIPILLEPSDATGKINVKCFLPYSSHAVDVNSDDSFYVAAELRASSPNPITSSVSGFSCGTKLLTDTIDAKTINKIPELAIQHNMNDLYQLVYTQALGQGNVLDSFNPLTDISFTSVTFNNLTGQIICNLTLKKNYIDSEGNEITNGPAKDFGKIKINNLAKISSTEKTSTSTINIPSDSSLKNYYPFESNVYFDELKSFIFNNLDVILKNIPNSTNSNRDVNLSDIVLSINDITSSGVDRVNVSFKLKHYFNSTNGSFTNNNPLEVSNITISGFKQVKQTSILPSYSVEYSGVSDYYPGDFLNDDIKKLEAESWAKTFIFQNTDKDLNIISNAPKNFVRDNIIIESMSPSGTSGSISIKYTINNWITQSGNISTDKMPTINYLVLTGFKKPEKTILLGSEFQIKDWSNSSVLDYTPDLAKNELWSLQQRNNLLSPVSSKFNINNDLMIDTNTWTPNVSDGSLTFQIKARNVFLDDGSISNDFKLFGWITFTGFKKINKTTIVLPNVHDLSNKYENIDVKDITRDQLFNEIISLWNQDKLLSSWAESFIASNDISLKDEYITRYAEQGEIVIKIYARQVYNSSLEVATDFIYIGDIKLIGFRKRISTTVNTTREYLITSLPNEYHGLYATDLTTNSGLGNINNILKLFTESQNMIQHLPNGFDFNSNLTNISITVIDDGLKCLVNFTINKTLEDGVVNNNANSNYQVIISGFKELPSTKINNVSFDYNNVSEIRIPCNSSQRTLTVGDVYSQIEKFGSSIILEGNKNSLVRSPLISISDSPPNNPLKFNVDNITFSINEELNELVIKNVTLSGSFYYNNSIPTNIISTSKTYIVTIYGFGVINESYSPLIITLAIIISAIVGSIILAIVLVKLHKKFSRNKRRLDKFDDSRR